MQDNKKKIASFKSGFFDRKGMGNGYTCICAQLSQAKGHHKHWGKDGNEQRGRAVRAGSYSDLMTARTQSLL